MSLSGWASCVTYRAAASTLGETVEVRPFRFNIAVDLYFVHRASPISETARTLLALHAPWLTLRG